VKPEQALYEAFEVKRLLHSTLHFLSLGHFSCSTAPQDFSRPDQRYAEAVARSGRQGRRFFSAAEGLSLSAASTAAPYGRRAAA
jgi:hypothetical protein